MDIPPGIAVVPLKPSVEMLAAAMRAGAGTAGEAYAIWRAMIAACDGDGGDNR